MDIRLPNLGEGADSGVVAKKIQAQLTIDEKDDFSEDGYFWLRYQEWQNAFEQAAGNGMVCFY